MTYGEWYDFVEWYTDGEEPRTIATIAHRYWIDEFYSKFSGRSVESIDNLAVELFHNPDGHEWLKKLIKGNKISVRPVRVQSIKGESHE